MSLQMCQGRVHLHARERPDSSHCQCCGALSLVAAPVFLFHLDLLTLVPALSYAVLSERTKRTAIQDKVVLVTGASSGLGKAFALECTRRGCQKVILVARTKSRLEEVAAECVSQKANKNFTAVPVPCDLTCTAEVRKMAEQVTKDHGALDCW